MVAPGEGGNRPNSSTSEATAAGLLLAVTVCLAPLGVFAGQFTSGVNVVEVYASVVDSKGQPVRGLGRDDFEVLEDGTPQTLSTFTAGEFPLTVALAIDRSFSMAGPPLQAAQRGARAFLNALRPQDETILIGISSQVEILAGERQPRAQQFASLDAIGAWGTTTLHDAVIAAIDAVDAARGRRALVILSDGDDKYSEASAAEALARARRSNVMVYPIALGKTRPPLFAELSTVTGGRSYHARELKSLDQVLVTIAEQLREQYLLGYSPARPPTAGANEWRSITVRVKRPGVEVRARDGYFVK